MNRSPRLGARAIIVKDGRLLLVNAYPPEKGSDLWCAPGGGVERGQSVQDNLIREVLEETGLVVSVGSLAMTDEIHAPATGFHQVNLFFRCHIKAGDLDPNWADPTGVVHERRFFSRAELESLYFRPLSLPRIAFDPNLPVLSEPLREIVE